MAPMMGEVGNEKAESNILCEASTSFEELTPPTSPGNNYEEEFAAKKNKVNRFAEHLASIRIEITAELAAYQSYAATQDEFERIFECLGALDEIKDYLSRRTGLVVVFFPLNLPLYALCLYGIIPALVADQVYIRAPQRMTTLIKRLLPLLQVDQFFPNISMSFFGREQFVETFVKQADVTIFTGKLTNAQKVLAKTRQNSLFLFNGWGCNPIVVAEDAVLELAVKKTIDARLFCSGQDCAAPDMIFCARKHSVQFVERLVGQLSSVKVGGYGDQNIRVGRLADQNQINLISNLLLKYNGNIVYGGCIDYQASIIYPTVIVVPITDYQQLNYEELFAPIFIIAVYDDDAQLAAYFDQPRYIENDMYVSVFGTSSHVQTLKKSIILHNQVVFDTDRGNDAFGGYSMGASFVSANRNIVPKPVLVPRDIYEFLDQASHRQMMRPGLQKKISKRVSQAIAEIFGGNLEFGFVFGSMAQDTSTYGSDINTLVVTRHQNKEQDQRYTDWICDYHNQLGLSVRRNPPAELMTISELDQFVSTCSTMNQDDRFCSPFEVTQDIRLNALLGVQRGVAGDKRLAVQYRHTLQRTIDCDVHNGATEIPIVLPKPVLVGSTD
jgi:aldehyde dehydrogenase (NAD+)